LKKNKRIVFQEITWLYKGIEAKRPQGVEEQHNMLQRPWMFSAPKAQKDERQIFFK